MEITEDRVREIVREEITSAALRGVKAKLRRKPKPAGMMGIEAENLREMGLDPFEESEKPKPDWMSYVDAAEYRLAGVDPMGVNRASYDGDWS